MGGGIDGHADGLARGHRPAGQVGGKLQSPAIMPGPHRSCQLRRLGSDCPQTESGAFAQQHADQAGAQQNSQPVRHRLDHRRGLRGGTESLRDLGQNLGSPVFLARNLGEAAGFEQAAQLSGKNGGLGRQVRIEEVRVRTMQEYRRPDRVVTHHHGRGHDGAGAELGSHEIAGGIQLIFVNRLALTDGFDRDGNRALAGLDPGSPEAVRQQSIGFRPLQLVG